MEPCGKPYRRAAEMETNNIETNTSEREDLKH